jgi:hypothetical protein
VKSLVVVPVHPSQRGEPDFVDGLPRAGARRAADKLGLVVAVDALGQRVSKPSPTVPIDGTAPISASRSPK